MPCEREGPFTVQVGFMFAIRNIKREAVLAQPERSSGSEEVIGRDEASIRSVMAAYNDALNGGSTAAVMPLYTDDGVFMPPYSPSAVGKEAVRKAYEAVFRELKFNVKFTIAELVVMAPSW